MASSRIQRWALTLSAYQYTIRYKTGKTLSNADALSRLPRSVTTSSDCVPGDLVHLIDHLSSTTVRAENVKEWTTKDPVLAQVRRHTLLGWPETPLGDDLKPYQSRSSELSVLDGCILWGSRVIVPPQGRQAVLNELHQSHPGTSRMKALARSYIWWPQMDLEIEKCVKSSSVCQQSRNSPPPAPLHPWQWPSEPWSRLHLDFAGPYMGHMFLVIQDAHSKWLDAHVMSTITSSKTIEVLRTVFATHGIPRKVVTDNSPSFTSSEFKSFMQGNGIHHVTSAPYHPSTNGLAERGVQALKNGLKRTAGANIQEKLSKVLFDYRITPHSTTGIAPSELLMKRRLRSRLDLLHPEVSKKVEAKQEKQKAEHDTSQPIRKFSVNDNVLVRNLPSNNPKWIPGVIVKVTGPLSYVVQLLDGRLMRKHVDHIIRRNSSNYTRIDTDDIDGSADSTDSTAPPTPDENDTTDSTAPPSESAPTITPESDNSTVPRRSNRQSKPPDFLVRSDQFQT